MRKANYYLQERPIIHFYSVYFSEAVTCTYHRTAKEKNKMSAKLMDRSISPLPNPPPPGQSTKYSNKLTGSLRSQSPSQAGRPPKKKKKAVVKEDSTPSLQVASHDPVTQQDVSSDRHKTKSDRHKPPSSLSSSESDMEEVSMPTIPHGNTMATASSGDGNGMIKRTHDSSSASDSSSSDSQSDDDDSDEVILHH